MDDRSNITIIGAVLAAICCAAPLLVVALLSSASLTAWLANAYYVLVPAVLVLLGLMAFLLYRRHAGATSRDPASRERRVRS